MKTFENLSEIQKYLEQNTQEVLRNSMQLESYLAQKMSEAVIEHVYNVYDPKSYDRRGSDRLGLADMRNMSITDVSIQNGRVKVTFENLTMGNDGLSQEYTGDLIEFGEGYNGKHWGQTGEWSKPRPFSAKMAEEIIANPGTLIRMIELELKNAGFKVR